MFAALLGKAILIFHFKQAALSGLQVLLNSRPGSTQNNPKITLTSRNRDTTVRDVILHHL
jgi:hypothetical protein